MKVTPDFVTAVGDHRHRPQMQDRQALGPDADRPAFPDVVSRVRPPTAAGASGRPEEPGKSAAAPAHLARAAVLASDAASAVPFGWIVSAIARGLDVPVLDPAADTGPAPEADDDGIVAAAPDEAAAAGSEPVPADSEDEAVAADTESVPADSEDDAEPAVNPLEDAVEQVADSLGTGGAEAAMADVLDELLEPSEAAA